MSFIAVYITFPTQPAAKKIVRLLIEKKIVACANILAPMESVYWWKDEIQDDKEWIAIVKTTPDNWEKLKTTVEDIHPYDVPCIMRLDVSANDSYEAWIKKEVK